MHATHHFESVLVDTVAEAFTDSISTYFELTSDELDQTCFEDEGVDSYPPVNLGQVFGEVAIKLELDSYRIHLAECGARLTDCGFLDQIASYQPPGFDSFTCMITEQFQSEGRLDSNAAVFNTTEALGVIIETIENTFTMHLHETDGFAAMFVVKDCMLLVFVNKYM